MLRTQVDPHFLFNSLNSISALTSIDPAAARAMTVRLADFFRHSLGLHADSLHRRLRVMLADSLGPRLRELERMPGMRFEVRRLA